MPRYLVNCTLRGEGSAALDVVEIMRAHAERSAEVGAIWLHGYFTDDASTLYALYDAPDPETVRTALGRDHILIDRIAEVHRLDPSAWWHASPDAGAARARARPERPVGDRRSDDALA